MITSLLRRWSAMLGLAALCPGFLLAAEESEPSAAAVIERALPWLEEEGDWWITEKQCISCHHTSFLVWAKDLASEAGFPVDSEMLEEQRQWMIEQFQQPVEKKPKYPDEVNGDRNVEGIAQFLISGSARNLEEETKRTLLEVIASNQEEDGNWHPDGQLPFQDRPKLETTWVSNQWADLALRRTSFQPEEQIITWKTGTPAVSTEWYAMNLMAYPNEKSRAQLLRLQNADGGWPWKKGEASDPIGTGMALTALARAGKSKAHEQVIQRGRDYLIDSQAEDGRWETMSTEDRSESTRVSDFWGSAWAVIGLLESRPEVGRSDFSAEDVQSPPVER